MTANAKPRLGFVGLGHMGGAMAARLLAAGYQVDGQALHREHARTLEEQGLHWHDTARELAQAAEIVFTSLPDDASRRPPRCRTASSPGSARERPGST
jgi:3-hydroxyisobutyrate dehydrogenase-like beta-hydroxyacid dehydrogenase